MNYYRVLIGIFILTISVSAFAMSKRVTNHPDCTGLERWPASMAFVYLKNSRLTDNERIDFSKVKIERIASETKDNGIFRQVHLVEFVEFSGKKFKIITVNDASLEECSISRVDAYLIDQELSKKHKQ